MSKWRPNVCKGCGAKAGDGVTIGKLGWCLPCGTAVAVEAAMSMKARTGTHYDRHKAKRAAMSAGGKARGVGGMTVSETPIASDQTP